MIFIKSVKYSPLRQRSIGYFITVHSDLQENG